MKQLIKSMLTGIVPDGLGRIIAEPFLKKQKVEIMEALQKHNAYGNLCYSQEGEDLLLNRHFDWRPNGFFIDVGAHHPQRFSNTYFFYKLGWRGINIDAMPGSMLPFQQLRPEDINLEQPISDVEETLNFYIFNDPALNGFSAELSQERDGTRFFIKETKPLQTKTLAQILDQHVKPDQKIDFMSVDVEGFDLRVLQSNNWDKYRPEFLLTEAIDTETLEGAFQAEVTTFLKSKGYTPVSKLVHTFLFRSEESQ